MYSYSGQLWYSDYIGQKKAVDYCSLPAIGITSKLTHRYFCQSMTYTCRVSKFLFDRDDIWVDRTEKWQEKNI